MNIWHGSKGQRPTGKKLGSGVPKINCSCSSKTRRAFEICIKEHKAITRQEVKEESAMRSMPGHNIIQYCGRISVCAWPGQQQRSPTHQRSPAHPHLRLIKGVTIPDCWRPVLSHVTKMMSSTYTTPRYAMPESQWRNNRHYLACDASVG